MPSHWIGSDSATMHAVVVLIVLYRIDLCVGTAVLPRSVYWVSIKDVLRRLHAIERLHERIAQSVLFLPVDLSMRAECMHEK